LSVDTELDHNIATDGFKINADFSLGLPEQKDVNKLIKASRMYEDPNSKPGVDGQNDDKKKKKPNVSNQPQGMFADKGFQEALIKNYNNEPTQEQNNNFYQPIPKK